MTDITKPFQLTEGEKNHPIWIRLKDYFEEQLRVQRAKNDSAKLTEQETATIRGDIRRLKAIIALGDARPPTGD